MLGCHIGRCFQVTIAGGSYQEGLTTIVQGRPPGMLITEQEIYGDLLLQEAGSGRALEPSDGAGPAGYLQRGQRGRHHRGREQREPDQRHADHDPHPQPRPPLRSRQAVPGHQPDAAARPCSYASFLKYGQADDAIGAGFFSGRYTATIVAAGDVAKQVLEKFGIEVFAYVKEAASVVCPAVDHEKALAYNKAYKRMRRDLDPFYQEIYVKGRITREMHFLEKIDVFAEIEKEIAGDSSRRRPR